MNQGQRRRSLSSNVKRDPRGPEKSPRISDPKKTPRAAPEDPMMFPLLNLTLATIVGLGILFTQSFAFAQGVDGRGRPIGAQPGGLGDEAEQVPGLVMHAPSYGGTGCPNGSASATLSPDAKTLSVLFDSYVVEVGKQKGLTKDRKGCQINIPFSVPRGYAVQVVKMDYRGFMSIPKGAKATFGAGYRFVEIAGERLRSEPVIREKSVKGPREENFIFSSTLQGSTFSPCGEDFVLAADSTLVVQANSDGEQALSTIDSLEVSEQPVVYSLRWRRCEKGSAFRPERPTELPPWFRP